MKFCSLRLYVLILIIAKLSNSFVYSQLIRSSIEIEKYGLITSKRKIDAYDKKYALVVGINNYPDAPKLSKAINDAKDFADYLKKVANFDEVKQLLENQATEKNIKKEIRNFFDKASEKDCVIIFLSGHGKADGRLSYFIPWDGNLDSASISGYNINERLELAKDQNTKHILFIVDACYCGTGQKTKGPNFPITNELLKIYIEEPFVGIIGATGSAQKAYEDNKSNHSLFTHFLLEGLEHCRADLDNDGIITFTELSGYVVPAVTRAAALLGLKQIPQPHKVFGEGEFIFITKHLYSSRLTNTAESNFITSKGLDSLAILGIDFDLGSASSYISDELVDLLQKEIRKYYYIVNMDSIWKNCLGNNEFKRNFYSTNSQLYDCARKAKAEIGATFVINLINGQIMISSRLINLRSHKAKSTIYCIKGVNFEDDIQNFVSSLFKIQPEN
jgi:uncharacterized caspase-like protein